MNLEKILAQRLKQSRTEKQLTQKALAEKVGTTAATISAYEKGDKKPSLENITNIAKYLGVSIDWLCGNDDAEKGKVLTMKDIAVKLMEIDKYFKIKIFETEYEGYVSESHDDFERLYFKFYKRKQKNLMLISFINSWSKFKTLHEEGTIDKEVYSLWAEKELKKLEKISLDESYTNISEYESFELNLPF